MHNLKNIVSYHIVPLKSATSHLHAMLPFLFSLRIAHTSHIHGAVCKHTVQICAQMSDESS